MNIDISKLSAAELDLLIDQAAARRAEMAPPQPDAPRGEIAAMVDPRWQLRSYGADTLLQLRDPGHGWLSFLLPPHERVNILTWLLTQALGPQAHTPGTALAAPASGGGEFHLPDLLPETPPKKQAVTAKKTVKAVKAGPVKRSRH